MKMIFRLAAVASAAIFIVSAHAQNAGTVTNHAFAIGKGAGKQGFTSVGPCGAGIAAVGNASADASCQTLPVAGGGTGITTLAIGDLLQASSSSALARLAAVATGNVLISGGVGVISSWGKVGLTTHVSGILPLANGGTASDLSATGGTSQFLRQNTVGGAVTPIRPACADVSDASVYCSAARGQLPGETSTGSATAGNVGEYAETVVPVGSPISLVTATSKDIATLTLGAGDWDIDGVVNFVTASTTSVTGTLVSISQTLNTIDATAGRMTGGFFGAIVPTAGTNFGVSVPPLRFSLSGSTTFHLVAQGTFTASTLTGFGIIRARRVR